MGISVYRRRGAVAQDEVIQDTSVAGESLSLLTATVDYISEHYMEDIAMRTGFQTTGAFTRNFKKLVGERKVIPLHKYSCLCSGIFMCISMRFSKK